MISIEGRTRYPRAKPADQPGRNAFANLISATVSPALLKRLKIANPKGGSLFLLRQMLASQMVDGGVPRPVVSARTRPFFIIVRDGQLHLVPFDGLRDVSGRYVAETRTVIYSPSATTFYLLTGQSSVHGQLVARF